MQSILFFIVSKFDVSTFWSLDVSHVYSSALIFIYREALSHFLLFMGESYHRGKGKITCS